MRVVFAFLLAFAFWVPQAEGQRVQTEYERGMLINGRPTGVWEYYDAKDQLGLVINYDSARLRYLRPDTTRYPVWLDSAWQVKRMTQAPRLLGSQSAMVVMLQRKLRYPAAALREAKTGLVIVACEIAENGTVSLPHVVQAPHPALGEELRKAVEELPLAYIPGVYRGKRVRTLISFVAVFCVDTSTKLSTAGKACYADIPSKGTGGFNVVVVTALGYPGRR